jgi:predicted DNA-binding antitoxin AbrB/MazE fold protein
MIQVDAVYENGVLRPLQPLDLKEHKHVVVSLVQAAPDEPPSLDAVRELMSKIPGSMAAEIVASRGER